MIINTALFILEIQHVYITKCLQLQFAEVLNIDLTTELQVGKHRFGNDNDSLECVN